MVLSAGAAVLTTITVDGDMSDWGAVLSDPIQTSFDGPGGTLPDLDAPVQSTGRDLSAFAWTYDADYFYIYTSRAGSSKNRQMFWYYLDFNSDGLMSTGEPVFHVSWWGNTGKTDTYLYQYSAAAPGGDPMADAMGQADGWTMPGEITGGTLLEKARGGSGSGTEMEARISWSQLGVLPGATFLFHVASSNSANLPGQIDDNMGGSGGLIGSTFLAGVIIQPDRSRTILSAGTAALAHTITNTGQGTDTFNLSHASTGDFAPSAVSYYQDLDADGLPGPGDLLLTDTDGDGIVDTGPLATAVPFNLLVVITAPGGLSESDQAIVTVTATSSASPLTTDSVADTLTVSTADMTLIKSVNTAATVPGNLLTYTVVYTSAGSTDAYNAIIIDPIPAATAYVPGSALGAGTTIAFSHDGGITYDLSEAAPVTHLRWTVAAPLAPGDSGTLSFQAQVR
ncbi:MAG: hypothetical protein O7D35_04515 [Acidobacteria bacterium]|nr:hypothetical protein [Acidobacteriota bacterium]